MEKKCVFYGFIITVLLLSTYKNNRLSAQNGFSNYISISNGEFKDGDSVFKPLCINYIVDYACDLWGSQNIYYIAPHFNYSENFVSHQKTEINDTVYPEGHWGYGVHGNSEMDSAKKKLDHDLKVIDSLGFNVVRIEPAIYWRNDSLRIPTRSYAKYFELTDTLIAKCTRRGLRVILVLSDKPDTYTQFDQFCVYLDSVSRHYGNNKTVMAYVVYMEPGYKWVTDPIRTTREHKDCLPDYTGAKFC